MIAVAWSLGAGVLLFAGVVGAGPVPQRIASVAVVTDELLLSLVDRSRVVGVSRYAADPRRSHVAVLAAGIPPLRRDDAAAILAREPDLVLLSTWAPREIELPLERAGVEVLRVPFPRRLDDVATSLNEVARAVGESERGSAIEAEMRRRVARLRGLPRSPARVLFWTPRGWVLGRDSAVHLVLELAGVENAAAGLAGPTQVSVEWVLETDPDWILVPSGYERFEGWADAIRADPRHRPLRAVRENRVLEVPARHLYTVSPFLPEAAAGLRERLEAAGAFGSPRPERPAREPGDSGGREVSP